MKLWLIKISFADGTMHEQRVYARSATQCARVLAEELTGFTSRGIVGAQFSHTRELTQEVAR